MRSTAETNAERPTRLERTGSTAMFEENPEKYEERRESAHRIGLGNRPRTSKQTSTR
jgi:hypothetical protein